MATARQLEEIQEDYALRFVPSSFRKWGFITIFNSAAGSIAAMFWFAYGGSLALTYGTKNALIGLGIGLFYNAFISYVLSYSSTESGLDTDLMTRGSGYGFMGSALTSVIYSFNYIMYFAFEGSIMAGAVHALIPSSPQWVADVITGAIFIPLTWYGVTLINHLQWITVPIYILLLGYATGAVAHMAHADWFGYTARGVAAIDPNAIVSVVASTFALVSGATQSADVGRFIKRKERRIGAWFLGPIMTVAYGAVVVLGIFFTVEMKNDNPGIYFVNILGWVGILFVVISQLKINVLNAYFGSLAFTNFFARVFHFAPGRKWWTLLTIGIGTILMIANIFSILVQVLTFFGMFMGAWILSVTSDIVINKRLLKLSPAHFEYKRSRLYSFNPVGVFTLLVALAVSVPMAFGLFGSTMATYAPFVAAGLGFALPPVMAVWTKGRYYVPHYENVLSVNHPHELHQCGVCTEHFEAMDMDYCPFHKVAICSVCCAKEKHCHDVCKLAATSDGQVEETGSSPTLSQ